MKPEGLAALPGVSLLLPSSREVQSAHRSAGGPSVLVRDENSYSYFPNSPTWMQPSFCKTNLVA